MYKTDPIKIEEKFIALGYVFNCLQKNLWDRKNIHGLFLNESILKNLTESYFQDIERIKDYHKFKKVDEAKQACYWIKWILKDKPIQFDSPSPEVKVDHCNANAQFAFMTAWAMLKLPVNVVSTEFVELLLYTFHFRRFEEDSFLPLCDLLRRMSKALADNELMIEKPL